MQEELAETLGVAFEPRIEGETAAVPRERQQSYPPAQQCSPTCNKTGQDIHGKAEMGGLTRPPYSPDVALSDSYKEIEQLINSWIALKDAYLFRDGIRKLPERWEELMVSDGQYLES